MTDGTTDRGEVRVGTGPDRTRVVIGGGLAAVLLAVVGAAGGWMLAGDQEPPGTTTLDASGSRAPTSEGEPTPREKPTTATSSQPARPAPNRTDLTVPELVGMDFEEAREELRDRGLRWEFVFGTGDSSSVRSTEPAGGSPVKRGTSVKVTVAGAAPESSVPDLVGDSCGEAQDELADDGFYPRYPTGKSGTVTTQQPTAGTVGRWNDVVQIWCGTTPSPESSDEPE
ncbi:PASTA domain-containing protein [Micromonospora craniellae]|uniref:PASTA domain-containing protein n=1 Tax=Micromonospora craniellae TaxID=2294034 RepID=A0A372FZX2_9ACTN|nr:PASTA domain-containing protein [Micromonospora craniellae]QOC94581.1 PASTA domain-containing protein [Micromonospora craniellae]RFS46371.1 PASTA domain-containing protein [Micromonospora craniellae]